MYLTHICSLIDYEEEVTVPASDAGAAATGAAANSAAAGADGEKDKKVRIFAVERG